MPKVDTTPFRLNRVLVGVTGASGSIYADRLLQILVDQVERVYLVSTDSGAKVAAHELTKKSLLLRALTGQLNSTEKETIRVFKNEDLFAPCASGTSAPDAMVITPCSMGSLARVASGISSNLLERSADVVLKQRRKLLICPRETPLSLIHLRNMTAVCEAGAEIIPLMPGFYQHPKSIEEIVDFCVGKILEQLGLSHNLYKPWNARMM
jgi:4-hydroxy-3-polyprenylbenzoate decarboxylase